MAANYYQKAAIQGHALAQYNIGACYHYGKGVPRNLNKAVMFYGMAAEQGDNDATTQLRELVIYLSSLKYIH